jgi:dihydrofolate reductase
MGKVFFDISMSLDGFMTAAKQRPEEPMGQGGERLHEWASGDDPRDREVPDGGVHTFVTGGIERTLEQARAVAGDKDVTVMGGADTGQQFLRAGLVDELSIHLVPVLFGSGTRMFEHLGDQHVQLQNAGAIQTAAATHLRFRVAK